MQTSAVYSLPLSYFWKLAFPRVERDNWDLQNENMEALADLPLQKRKYLERERERGLVSNHHFSFPLREGRGERMHMQSWGPGVLSWCIYFHFFFPYVAFLDGWHCILMNLKLKYPLFSQYDLKKEKKNTSGSISTEHLHICYELLLKHKDLN